MIRMLSSPVGLRGDPGAGGGVPDTVIARAPLVRIPHNPAAGEEEGSCRIHFRRCIRRTVVKRGTGREEGDILGSLPLHKRILVAPGNLHSPRRQAGGLAPAVAAEVDIRPNRRRRVRMGMVGDPDTQRLMSDIHSRVVELGIRGRAGHHTAVREAVEVDNFALALHIRRGQLGGTHSSHIPSPSLLHDIAHCCVHGYDGAQGYRVHRSLPSLFLCAFSLFSLPSHVFYVPSRDNIHHPSPCLASRYRNTPPPSPRRASCNASRDYDHPRRGDHICWISPYFPWKYEFARPIMG